jgi:hypothetical protein
LCRERHHDKGRKDRSDGRAFHLFRLRMRALSLWQEFTALDHVAGRGHASVADAHAESGVEPALRIRKGVAPGRWRS